MLMWGSGCNSDTETKPPAAPATLAPLMQASTQPTRVVAQIGAMKLSRAELDQLLYETYGLRMMFDLLELNLAKSTLMEEQHTTLNPADVQRERQMIMTRICGDAPQSSYEDLFNQFLSQEKITRAEFEVKIVQTGACLRKIVEPIVVGKIPDDKIKRGFDQLYGAKRRIADITLNNVRDATDVRNLLRTQPFAEVAARCSKDPEYGPSGGEWPPFSSQSHEIPDVIRTTAFSTDPGEVSDILTVGNTFHIIKVLEAIEPKLVKFEDVKASVRKQMEERLVDDDIKALRSGMTTQIQTQVLIDDPILKAQWDALLEKSRAHTVDRDTVGKQYDALRPPGAGSPTTLPASK